VPHREEAQPLVGHGLAAGRVGRELIGQQKQGLCGLVLHAAVAPRIERAVARHAEQPGLGLLRNAFVRPALEGAREGIGQRVFRRGDVARARREDRDQPAIGLAGGPLGGFVRGLDGGRARHMQARGR
jgi:hypothetical protein